MKHVILLFFCLFVFAGLNAQAVGCKPDTTQQDSIQFIRPQPYNAQLKLPKSGIYDTACIGRPFEFTFTIKVPDTVAFPGVGTVRISKVSFATSGAITYNPALSGFNYVCFPANCVFPSKSIGCVRIFGTPPAGSSGAHDLVFNGTIDFGIPFPVTFPNAQLFPGNYFLNVQNSNSSYCKLSDVEEIAGNRFDLYLSPNPVTDWVKMRVSVEQSGKYEMRVCDLLGNVVHREAANLFAGNNNLEYHAGELPNGVYMLFLTDGRDAVSRKMVVNR